MSHRDLGPRPLLSAAPLHVCLAVLALSALFGVMACQKSPTQAAAKGKPQSESVLGRVTLSEEAEKRLGITDGLRPVSLLRGPQRRLLRGEVTTAPGRSAWLIAPHTGLVLPASGSQLPQARDRVRAGQVVVLLSASLAPTERAQLSTVRVDADAQVERARVQDQATELALNRAERLLAEEAVGRKVLDDAKAQRQTARAALQAALTQQAAIAESASQHHPFSRSTLSQTQLVSPLNGLIRDVRTSAHQLVSAGSPILEVVDDESTWVRVSVPSGVLASLSPAAALVDDLSALRFDHAVEAAPAEHAPMTALPQQASVDRYFVLPPRARFAVGQTVAVWLSLREEEESPTIYASALLYDPSGGSWVYQLAAAHSFVRRRVEVVHIEEGIAFLSPRSLTLGGLRLGDRIVTSGAMELYGTEFGSGK